MNDTVSRLSHRRFWYRWLWWVQDAGEYREGRTLTRWGAHRAIARVYDEHMKRRR